MQSFSHDKMYSVISYCNIHTPPQFKINYMLVINNHYHSINLLFYNY